MSGRNPVPHEVYILEGNEWDPHSPKEWHRVDPSSNNDYGKGRDYFIDTIAALRELPGLRPLSFYIAQTVPPSLPRYGADIVLCVIADERYRVPSYLANIGAVLRAYGSFPHYVEGLPVTRLRLTALLTYLFKFLQQKRNQWRSGLGLADGLLRTRVLHVPLGTYFRFPSDATPIAQRPVEFAFLGSVGLGAHHARFHHRLLMPQKVLSRQLMLHAIDRALAARGVGASSEIVTTSSLEQSVETPERYRDALSRTKIALCPRGSNYETYRFFEAVKSGCIVVTEPLPPASFYRRHPGIVVTDWSDLPAILDKLLDDPERLERMAAETARYWTEAVSEPAVARQVHAFLQALDREHPDAVETRSSPAQRLPTPPLPAQARRGA